jgi:peptidase E
VPAATRQIFAYSGVLSREPGQRTSLALIEHAIALAAPQGPARVCYLPTATGDAQAAVDGQTARFADRSDVTLTVLTLFTQPSVPDIRAHLLAQDVILVEGGSVVNLMAVWRAHGLPEVLRECWAAGVVLTGTSAGSLCWHLGGPTDSFGDSLDLFTDALGFVPYSNGVHDDLGDQPRRATYRRMVAEGALPAGYATEDGVGLHYIGTDVHEAVTIRAGARAWRVEPAAGGGYAEEAIAPRPI